MRPPEATLTARLRADPDPATEASCDTAFLHLLGAGLVSAHPGDLVVHTLRAVLAAAQQRGGIE